VYDLSLDERRLSEHQRHRQADAQFGDLPFVFSRTAVYVAAAFADVGGVRRQEIDRLLKPDLAILCADPRQQQLASVAVSHSRAPPAR
jgi:hypothetical protein